MTCHDIGSACYYCYYCRKGQKMTDLEHFQTFSEEYKADLERLDTVQGATF